MTGEFDRRRWIDEFAFFKNLMKVAVDNITVRPDNRIAYRNAFFATNNSVCVHVAVAEDKHRIFVQIDSARVEYFEFAGNDNARAFVHFDQAVLRVRKRVVIQRKFGVRF